MLYWFWFIQFFFHVLLAGIELCFDWYWLFHSSLLLLLPSVVIVIIFCYFIHWIFLHYDHGIASISCCIKSECSTPSVILSVVLFSTLFSLLFVSIFEFFFFDYFIPSFLNLFLLFWYWIDCCWRPLFGVNDWYSISLVFGPLD